jgi:peptide/nickel transport system substrate-binding protein
MSADQDGRRRLRYVVGQDVTTLEPTQVSGWTDHTAALALFGALTFNFDGATGAVGYRPFLAERLAAIDAHTWSIRLRPGMTFHDGTPLDAEAVRFSFERILHPEFPSGRYFHGAPIERVEVIDDVTVHLHTSEPIAILPARLLRADGYVVSPLAYRGVPPWEIERTAMRPVGAGPFAFVERVPDERLVLKVHEAFRDPRGHPRPDFDLLELLVVPRPHDALEALARGEVDIVPIPQELAAAAEGLPGVRTVAAPDTSRMSFEFNQAAHPALSERSVRRAILHAVDVDAMLQAHTAGRGARLTTLANPPNVNPVLEPYAYDPARAKALLAEAGWSDGLDLDVDWSTTPDRGVLAHALVPYLEAVGVRVRAVREREWSGDYLPAQKAGTLAGLHGHGHGGVEMTVETDLWPHHPQRPANSMNWRGPEADRFVATYAKLQTETDPDRQTDLGHELQRIAHDEAISLVLWQSPRFAAVAERVRHYHPYPGGHNEDFWTISVGSG